MHTEGHDKKKPAEIRPHPKPFVDDTNPGYEVQDVNAGGIAVFLAGLFGFVLIFFVFCFFMGKAINYALLKQDGPPNKWQPNLSQAGATNHGTSLKNLTSSDAMQQEQLAAVAQAFPTPLLAMDNGNQETADLHAREDLLLNFYSSSPDLPAGTIRIPVAQAMQMIVQQGLPAAPATAQPGPLMYGEAAPVVTAPLTDGFARTGYELAAIQDRREKHDFDRAEAKK